MRRFSVCCLGRFSPIDQVYSFGGLSVYLDNDVVFADLSGGNRQREGRGKDKEEGGFAPIALESLLQRVQGGGGK
jgi:hypothetical protein